VSGPGAFEVADLVAVAARTLGLEPDAALDLVDFDAADRALAEARRWCDRDPVEQGAAALLAGLVRHRPVARGNELVALVATLQFLALHGWDLDLDPPAAAKDLVRGVAVGAVGHADVQAWLAARLLRRGAHPKEEGMLRRITRLGRGRSDPQPTVIRPLGDAFGRFTDRARQSLALAQQEARALGHDRVGTEHLLLGLLSEGEGAAARALGTLEVRVEEVRAKVEQIVGPGSGAPARPPAACEAPPPEAQVAALPEARAAPPPEAREARSMPFTPRAKKVLQLALREALRLHHDYVGTEHLLLAIAREGEGLAAMILTDLGADPAKVYEEVVRILSGPAGSDPRWKARRSLVLGEVTAILDENEQLLAEVARLRALLAQHGIEPDGGTTRTA